MKRLTALVLSAILGSSLTVGAFLLIDNPQENVFKIEHIDNTSPKAVYSLDSKGELVPLDFKTVSKKVMPAVVHIKATRTSDFSGNYQYRRLPDPFKEFFDDDLFNDFFGPRFKFESPNKRGPQVQVGTGSGVIINENGYIITNNHVIENADDIEVTLHDNRTFKASITGTDPTTDLALIRIKAEKLPVVPLINSDDVEIGEWVLAVGNPFNLNSTVTAGIVSAKARNINILKHEYAIESFIQTDAAINPGNSGGALVNLQGGLVGINTAIASPTGAYAGYGFAVPSNIVNKVVEDLLKYGIVQRGYLGVMIRGVDGNLAKEKDLHITEGVYVDSLIENGAAKAAGIKEGDVIFEVNGHKVKSAPELQEIIGRHRPGDKIVVKIDRFGKTKEFNVKLKNKEGKTVVGTKEHQELLTILGAAFESVDEKTAQKLGIDGGVKVKKLYAGKLRRHTDIKEGFIITKVDGKQVKTVDDMVEILEKKEKGGVMFEGVYEDYPGVYYYAFGI